MGLAMGFKDKDGRGIHNDTSPSESPELEQQVHDMALRLLGMGGAVALKTINPIPHAWPIEVGPGDQERVEGEILALLAQEYSRGLKDDQERAINWHNGFDAGFQAGAEDTIRKIQHELKVEGLSKSLDQIVETIKERQKDGR